jgi:small subunit ribosomal protein S6
MPQYEAICAFHPDLEEETVKGLLEKLTKRITDVGGTIGTVSPWGLKDLPTRYQRFKKAKKGNFIHFTFQGEGNAPQELRDYIRVTEGIMRHLITRVI